MVLNKVIVALVEWRNRELYHNTSLRTLAKIFASGELGSQRDPVVCFTRSRRYLPQALAPLKRFA